jgi:hypothetical protein
LGTLGTMKAVVEYVALAKVVVSADNLSLRLAGSG